jgi:hypothetical protein
MFADVVLRRELGDALFVPESAVLKPGDRRLVFLDLGDGRLEPREIVTGARVEGGYAVHSGLAEGERVVTSANFLIDSESSLKAALASMGPPLPARAARRPRPGDAPRLPPDPTPPPAASPKRRVRVPDAPRGDLGRAGLLPDLRDGPGADGAPRPTTGHEHH